MTTIDSIMEDALDTYAIFYASNDGISPHDQFISDLSIWLEDNGYKPLELKEDQPWHNSPT